MKYIRTKDGIKEYSDTCDLNYVYQCIGGIKIADTIEELCDGFIFKDTHANELHFLDTKSGISILGASLFEKTLRGFIETDKGLIYVAKMNENGVLELL